MKKTRYRIVPQLHKGTEYLKKGYVYAPYIPMMAGECPISDYFKKWEKEAGAQMAEEIDKEILEQLRNMNSPIILKKRNRKPNNKLMIL